MSIYSETIGVFAETIALAKLRPKSMARRYLRTPAKRTFFHARLPRQNAPQSNPLATQALNIAKNCIFSTVEIQGGRKNGKNPALSQFSSGELSFLRDAGPTISPCFTPTNPTTKRSSSQITTIHDCTRHSADMDGVAGGW